MPADGTASAADASPDEKAGRGIPATRRRLFRRFRLIARAITVAAHLPFVLALSVFAPAWVAIVVGATFALVAGFRLEALVTDARRSRLVTRLLDEPLLAHWCACVLATFALPIPLLVVFGANAAGVVAVHFGRGVALAGLGSYAFAASVSTWGMYVRRRLIRITHVDVPITGLAPELDGYRIAQITDLHIGNHDTKARGFEWAARVNRFEADLVCVTGDLVTTGTTFYQDVADVLGELRGKDGVFVSMGNHDQSDSDALVQLIRARGPRVLLNEWHGVERGAARLVVAGLDDRMTGKDDLERTLADRPKGAPTVLLSHYPDFFADAVTHRVELVLSGHTHGGQIAVPFFARKLSLSQIAKQHAQGLHVRGESRLFVNTGLGTTGPPVRVGVPPEIAVFVLRRK
jgi:predicted MPP superfamily phosphohydrolase